MTQRDRGPVVELIPIDSIAVVNPRERNQRAFKEIIANIESVGLKRPITVTRRNGDGDPPFYDLVCGQGRLEACRALGEKEIAALVIDADPESSLIASLVENCARRQHNAIELLHDIKGMRDRGDNYAEIARKTGLSPEYAAGISKLLERGEQRLLRSVEAKVMPLWIAVEIAEADDVAVQRALQTAYERGELRGKKLLTAKHVIEVRKRQGKGLHTAARKRSSKLSSAAVIRAYQEDAARKAEMVRRASATRDQLMLIIGALRRLRTDEEFMLLLEEVGLCSVPRGISARVNDEAVPA